MLICLTIKTPFTKLIKMIDEEYSWYNAYMLDNQDFFYKIDNNDTAETDCFNDQYDENTGLKRNFAILNFMPRTTADNKIF